MKCLDCNSICIGETGKKFKTRLDERIKDANKDDEGEMSGLSSHIKKHRSPDRSGKYGNNVKKTKSIKAKIQWCGDKEV